MCNIAGYIGTKPAAPILIEMMYRQEGYNAGFYTGLATVDAGKLSWAKKTGNTDYLLKTTDAAKLPGTLGLMHSRTNDGGGDEWAHPFVGKIKGEPSIAYVANGGPGVFSDRMKDYRSMAEELLAQGYDMFRLASTDNKPYATLSDGSHVHMSDVMCQLITRSVENGVSAQEAMERAFCERPSEIVGLTLDVSQPDRIFWARINAPMFVAFADHGAYMASSPVAFPEDIRTEPQLLPACSVGTVTKDGFSVKPFATPPARVNEPDAALREEIYHALIRCMQEEPVRFSRLRVLTKGFFPADRPCPAAALVYEVLISLKKRNLLREQRISLPAARPDLEAYALFFSVDS